jgi:hypothetical protein
MLSPPRERPSEIDRVQENNWSETPRKETAMKLNHSILLSGMCAVDLFT